MAATHGPIAFLPSTRPQALFRIARDTLRCRSKVRKDGYSTEGRTGFGLDSSVTARSPGQIGRDWGRLNGWEVGPRHFEKWEGVRSSAAPDVWPPKLFEQGREWPLSPCPSVQTGSLFCGPGLRQSPTCLRTGHVNVARLKPTQDKRQFLVFHGHLAEVW